ncbi:hypothetical protein PISMIDRAFT_10679 [Pisolithus microcarpus 441]|uniref:Unplaced genomic scaffold scaffold_39, whole genome shotgun sequence n=1 Tax=Pisolithus microcarpus 441 TaxID=765257 RepID=A0A0C9YFN2_9AGAM|nr:hypothetical protein PISMIDRAFT_10679 [Pisolithus microcarpus 441]
MHDEPEAFAKWKGEMYAWEVDPSKTNPFNPKVETLMQATIHLQLTRDDVQALRDGTRVILHNDVSPSMLIGSGLDLEEQQYIHIGSRFICNFMFLILFLDIVFVQIKCL